MSYYSNKSQAYNVRESKRGFLVFSPDAEIIASQASREDAALIADSLNGARPIEDLESWLETPIGEKAHHAVKIHLQDFKNSTA